jgi:uncharacterized membrane protein YfcA
MDWNIVFLVLVGVFAGFVNTLAGSGSLVTLPFLMFLGLPANVANGTNRIAIFLQSLVGTVSYKNQKVFTFKEGIWYSLPAIVGAIIGAKIAIEINESVMKTVIGILMILMLILMIFLPKAWTKPNAESVKHKPTIIQIIVLFAIGLYGGFIQAGVGVFLLAGLVLGAGFDLIKANAVKLLIVTVYTLFALAVFMWDGMVDYKYGFILAAGNVVGALIATKLSVKKGVGFVKYVLMFVIFASALQIFGVFEWIAGWF